jgi:hypothetical protein
MTNLTDSIDQAQMTMLLNAIAENRETRTERNRPAKRQKEERRKQTDPEAAYCSKRKRETPERNRGEQQRQDKDDQPRRENKGSPELNQT